jgi:hypothetical protein
MTTTQSPQDLLADIVRCVDQYEEYGSEDALQDIEKAGYVLVPKPETSEYSVEWRIASTDRWAALSSTYASMEQAHEAIERDKAMLDVPLQYRVLRIDRTVVE